MTARAVGLDVVLGEAPILTGVDLQVVAGRVHALVGPNGAGKSTLLAALAGDVDPTGGQIEIRDRPISTWRPSELARERAVLLQQVVVSFPFTAADVVRMGRAPWAGTPQEDEDDAAVATAMAATDTAYLAERIFPSLSGGERARVALARTLAQRTGTYLLDEPTAALDLGHQEVVLQVAREQAAAGGAVVVVLHDLGLAAAYADQVTVLHRGRVVADGSPREVFTDELLSRVYGHPVEVLAHPRDGSIVVLPRR